MLGKPPIFLLYLNLFNKYRELMLDPLCIFCAGSNVQTDKGETDVCF